MCVPLFRRAEMSHLTQPRQRGRGDNSRPKTAEITGTFMVDGCCEWNVVPKVNRAGKGRDEFKEWEQIILRYNTDITAIKAYYIKKKREREMFGPEWSQIENLINFCMKEKESGSNSESSKLLDKPSQRWTKKTDGKSGAKKCSV